MVVVVRVVVIVVEVVVGVVVVVVVVVAVEVAVAVVVVAAAAKLVAVGQIVLPSYCFFLLFLKADYRVYLCNKAVGLNISDREYTCIWMAFGQGRRKQGWVSPLYRVAGLLLFTLPRILCYVLIPAIVV